MKLISNCKRTTHNVLFNSMHVIHQAMMLPIKELTKPQDDDMNTHFSAKIGRLNQHLSSRSFYFLVYIRRLLSSHDLV